MARKNMRNTNICARKVLTVFILATIICLYFRHGGTSGNVQYGRKPENGSCKFPVENRSATRQYSLHDNSYLSPQKKTNPKMV